MNRLFYLHSNKWKKTWWCDFDKRNMLWIQIYGTKYWTYDIFAFDFGLNLVVRMRRKTRTHKSYFVVVDLLNFEFQDKNNREHMFELSHCWSHKFWIFHSIVFEQLDRIGLLTSMCFTLRKGKLCDLCYGKRKITICYLLWNLLSI